MSATSEGTIPATGTWRIDSVHSTALFLVGHNQVATFRAGFKEIGGALTDGVLTGAVTTASIDLPGPDVFKQHLLGPEWFDGEHHSELTFRSTNLHTHGDQVHGTGDLTIRGTTKTVELHGRVRGPVAITQGDKSSNRIGLDLTTMVDRRDFGVSGGGGASWDVRIEVALQLIEV